MATATASSMRHEARESSRHARDGDRRELADIIFHKAFGRGEITLASGKKSDFYFDMKPAMFDPKGASLIASEILDLVVGAGADYVGGLEMGAVPITGAICKLSYDQHHPVRGFFVRKQVKTHGVKKLVEGLEPGASLEGKRVVIVDDVTTTGGSAMIAVDACRQAGAKIVLIIAIVDRLEGAEQAFAERGIPFKYLFGADEFLNRGNSAR